MTANSAVKFLLVLTLVFAASCVLGQAPGTPAAPTTSVYLIPLGPSIGAETAKKAAAAALAEARKNGWLQTVAVVDPNGTLVYYEKMDNVELATAELAIGKARSAALYKRPTKVFQDGLEKGGRNLLILGLKDAVPVEGGLPIIMDGKLIGAIGLSGDLPQNDGQCAAAGVAALK